MSRANEPCFPTLSTPSGDFTVRVGGLTIREHFAAMAMQGLNANPNWADESYGRRAARAVSDADALLAELERQK